MKRVLLLVEGPTEDHFVKDVLAPHLLARGIAATSTILSTKRVKNGPDFKGGVSTYPKIRDHLERLLRDSAAVAVTTMIDYYGFPRDFPGWNQAAAGAPRQRVLALEAAIDRDLNDSRLRAHLMLHEYEAMLFVDPDRFEDVFDSANIADQVRRVRGKFAGPEDINDGQETAPSKRLAKIAPRYRKRLHGSQIVQMIGLDRVRAACPHFGAWLTMLESL